MLCRNYVKVNKFQQRIEQLDNIISIGENINTNKYILSNIKFEPSKVNTNRTKYTYGYIDENGISCCHINTKRYEIQSLIVGTETGKIYLYNNSIRNNENLEKYDVIHSHSKKVNFLYFVRDLNLLFSAGEDGNIFIYCIYEYPDNEILSTDENNKITINNQLNTILDEGLGDNVLMNIFEINTNEKKIDNKQEEIYKLQKIVDENNKSFNKKFKDKVNELNKLRDTEINKLKQKIDEMILSKNTMIEDYEKK
jgi:WD40 repeat protein